MFSWGLNLQLKKFSDSFHWIQSVKECVKNQCESIHVPSGSLQLIFILRQEKVKSYQSILSVLSLATCLQNGKNEWK